MTKASSILKFIGEKIGANPDTLPTTSKTLVGGLTEVANKATANATKIDQLQASVGTPLVASTVAGMTDHDKIYVYTGSESGMVSGNWYYWDGDSWESGGVYNSTAFVTDTTLALSGKAADAKVTGDKVTDLKSAINDQILANEKGVTILNVDYEQGRLNDSGEETSATTLKRSGFISIEDDTTYVFDGTNCSVGFYIYRYNANKDFISATNITGMARASASGVITAATKYIRVVTGINEMPTIKCTYKGSFVKATDNVELSYSKVPDAIKNVGGVTFNTIAWENKSINGSFEISNSSQRLLSPLLLNTAEVIKCKKGYSFRIASVDESHIYGWGTEFDCLNILSGTYYINVRKGDGSVNISPSEGKYAIQLSSRMDSESLLQKAVVFEQGGISGLGIDFDTTNRVRTDTILIPPCTTIEMNDGYEMRVHLYDENYAQESFTGWVTSYLYSGNTWKRIRLMIRNQTDPTADITVAEAKTAVKDQSLLISYYDLNKLGDIGEVENDCFNLLHNDTDGMSGVFFWNYPRLVHVNNFLCNRLFYGYVLESAKSGVGCYDINAQKGCSVDLFASEPDDHDDMSVFYLEKTGRVFAFGFKHNKEKYMRVYRSASKYKQLYFERLENIGFDGKVTYAQIFDDAENYRLALFTRINAISWQVAYTKRYLDDRMKGYSGEEWEEPLTVFTTDSVTGGVQLYISARPTTTPNVLNVVVYGNPHWLTYSDSRIRACTINISTGDISTLAGVKIGEIGTGIDYSDIPVVINCDYGASLSDGDTTLRLYDVLPNSVTGSPVILYGVNKKGSRTEGAYYIYDNGTSEKICDFGYALYSDADLGEGICFVGDDKDSVILGRKLATTPNDGYSVIEKWHKSGGAWAKTEDIDHSYSTNHLSRTIRPITDEDGEYCLYQKGKLYESAHNPFSYTTKVVQL